MLFFPYARDGAVVFGYCGDAAEGIYHWKDGNLIVVADRNTFVPGTQIGFSSFGDSSVSGGTVAFVGQAPGLVGVFVRNVNDGVLSAIAHSGTPIPGGGGDLFGATNSFVKPIADGESVIFSSDLGSTEAIYRLDGGELNVLIDGTTESRGGAGLFREAIATSAADERVAFLGGPPVYRSLYASLHGSIVKIADTNTQLAGTTERASLAFGAAIDGDTVSFSGLGSRGRVAGVYANVGGDLQIVADTTMMAPGTAEPFTEFGDTTMVNGAIAFTARSEGTSGIYLSRAGSIEVVADTRTTTPEGELFVHLEAPAFDGASVVFQGASPYGIYAGSGADLQRIVDQKTPIPGRELPFAFFGNVRTDGQRVAFYGESDEDDNDDIFAGVYKYEAGEVSVVADDQTLVPGGTKPFQGFSENGVYLEGDAVVFEGDNGTFGSFEGSLVPILNPGDTLDRRLVQNASPFAFFGNTVGVQVRFESTEFGLYTLKLDRDAPFRRGDVNSDSTLNITDPINSLEFQFHGSFVPVCMDALDFNDDGAIEITDPIAELEFLFGGAATPPPPFGAECAEDPSGDALTCGAFSGCK